VSVNLWIKWAGFALLFWLLLRLLWGYWPQLTGFDKILWDLLDLLIIPVVFAIGAYWFNRQERETDRKIAKGKQRDDALQEYLKAMTELMLEFGLRLWGVDGPPENLKDNYDAAQGVAWARSEDGSSEDALQVPASPGPGAFREGLQVHCDVLLR